MYEALLNKDITKNETLTKKSILFSPDVRAIDELLYIYDIHQIKVL